MITENVNAGLWYSTSTNDIGIGSRVDWANNNTTFAFTPDNHDPDNTFQINKNLEFATRGQTPRPSAYHSGSINVFFCGGNGKSISENIDRSVYIRLLSSDGFSSTVQGLLGDNEY